MKLTSVKSYILGRLCKRQKKERNKGMKNKDGITLYIGTNATVTKSTTLHDW
jgi:hypothetical protein